MNLDIGLVTSNASVDWEMCIDEIPVPVALREGAARHRTKMGFACAGSDPAVDAKIGGRIQAARQRELLEGSRAVMQSAINGKVSAMGSRGGRFLGALSILRPPALVLQRSFATSSSTSSMTDPLLNSNNRLRNKREPRRL
jgi:hypothetical protein